MVNKRTCRSFCKLFRNPICFWAGKARNNVGGRVSLFLLSCRLWFLRTVRASASFANSNLKIEIECSDKTTLPQLLLPPNYISNSTLPSTSLSSARQTASMFKLELNLRTTQLLPPLLLYYYRLYRRCYTFVTYRSCLSNFTATYLLALSFKGIFPVLYTVFYLWYYTPTTRPNAL